MNGFNVNQFVLGFAIARPLAEQRDRLMVGLTASMFPASNPLGAIFLKPQVDALSARESEVASLSQSLKTREAEAKAANEALKVLADLGRDGSITVNDRQEYPWPAGQPDPMVGVTPGTSNALGASFDSASRKIVVQGKSAGFGQFFVVVPVIGRFTYLRTVQLAAAASTGPGAAATDLAAAWPARERRSGADRRCNSGSGGKPDVAAGTVTDSPA